MCLSVTNGSAALSGLETLLMSAPPPRYDGLTVSWMPSRVVDLQSVRRRSAGALRQQEHLGLD
jgi:hypothetical protein